MRCFSETLKCFKLSLSNTFSDYNSFYNNLFSQNYEYGMGVYNSNHNSFHNNSISQNYEYGIDVYSSNHNFIDYNIISENKIGIEITGSKHNIICENNIFHNKLNAFFINSNTFSKINIWKQNYWGRPRLLPKLILGAIVTDYGPIPILWINFDLLPALRPYDIEV